MAQNASAKSVNATVELLRRQAWDDFYVFAKFVCGRNLMEEQPHRELCEFITAGLDKTKQLDLKFTAPLTIKYVQECQQRLKKLIMLPRNSFKSTVTTNAFPLWCLWHNPSLRIMIDSETLSNAKLYLAGIKDMLANNPLLKIICVDSKGQYVLEPNDKIAGGFTEDQVILKHRVRVGLKEPSIFCSGADNARTGSHPDIILCDDLVSERNVGTTDQINKVKDHYKYSLSLLEPGGALIIIGTRYHMNDLYGELIDSDTFDQLIRPAVNDEGEVYFPSRLTKEFLAEQKKAQGSYIFSCQYMLDPVDDSNATFKREHIKYWDKLPEFRAKYILVDLAISEKETADYTVIMTVGETVDKKLYVIEYDRGHYKPQDTISGIFKMYNKHKDLCKVLGVETVAFQKAMIYFIKDEMRRLGVHMPLKELKADRDKVRRIQALQPLFERGDMFIGINMQELENELIQFPVGKHDDIIDALAYVLQVLRPGNIAPAKRTYGYERKSKYVNY